MICFLVPPPSGGEYKSIRTTGEARPQPNKVGGRGSPTEETLNRYFKIIVLLLPLLRAEVIPVCQAREKEERACVCVCVCVCEVGVSVCVGFGTHSFEAKKK